MNADQIPAHEQQFDNTGVDSNNKRHILTARNIQIPGEDNHMNYTQVQSATGDNSFFYNQEVDKDQIVLHFTAGYLQGDIATLTTPNDHVSVPFVIGRNGKIYNLFLSSLWSYHLGGGAIGGNKERSKATIGIEMSNIGFLDRTENGMIAYNNIYCNNDQFEYFQQASFRGKNYFATFTDAQYDSLIILLRYLTSRYNIRRSFLPEDFRFRAYDEVVEFDGIVSHVNYQRAGKWDIGPAFQWSRVINGLSD